jgi:hypothetical protein
VPIPKHQLERLDDDLSAQEHWLRTLRRKIAGLQDEASAIETIIAIGRDSALLRALEDLYDRPELFEQASSDPRAFFENRGARVPSDAVLTVRTVTENGGAPRHAIEARFAAETLAYGVGWSPRAGFYLISTLSTAHAAAQASKPT